MHRNPPASTSRLDQRMRELGDELRRWRRRNVTPEAVSMLCEIEEELRMLHKAELRYGHSAAQERAAFLFPVPWMP